jgi:hypothetical protein
MANKSFGNVEKFKYFENNNNKSELHSRRYEEQINFWECLLSFRSGLLFSRLLPKLKDLKYTQL